MLQKMMKSFRNRWKFVDVFLVLDSSSGGGSGDSGGEGGDEGGRHEMS